MEDHVSTNIKTEFGDLKITYHETKYGDSVSISKGDITQGIPLVRFHSACLFGEVFHSLHCDCHYQISQTLSLINQKGLGVLIYVYQEGRGIGLKNKIKALEYEKKYNLDTVEAFNKLGFTKHDQRDFNIETASIQQLNLSKTIQFISGNPLKILAIENAGFQITKLVNIRNYNLNPLAQKEISTKINKMGYLYNQT